MLHASFRWLVLAGLVSLSCLSQAREVDEGLRIMASRTAGNCVACHDIPALREAAPPASRLTMQGTLGPSLQGVGARYTQPQLRQWVVDARVIRPDTLMPPFGTTQGLQWPARAQTLLTPVQIEAVVEALAHMSQPASGSAADHAPERGATGATIAPVDPVTPVLSSAEQLQSIETMNPVVFWVDQGRQAWSRDCTSCHAERDVVKTVPNFPRLNAQQQLINLEDQIALCRQRGAAPSGTKTSSRALIEDPVTLSLSAYLHEAARHLPIQMSAPRAPAEATRWQQQLAEGEKLYNTRTGQMNLSCRQCHDDNVGAAMRAFRITPGRPVGFPIYRISWQGMGSMDRRIRACFSGVQAQVPPPQDERLRQLELYLKYRAQGMTLGGPSVRP